MRGLLVAAPQSGSGKTVITQALIRLLCRRQQRVIAAKAGPDYIDAAYLGLAAAQDGRASSAINLDSWAMRKKSLLGVLQDSLQGGESPALLVVEGAMGLFDGAADGHGSSADLARLLGLPIVLVVDCRGQSRSIAALVQGFTRFCPNVRFAGVILNRVGSVRHGAMLRDALVQHCPEVNILGTIPRDSVYDLPSRHLGLVQAQELTDLQARQDRMAEHLAKHIGLQTLLDVAEDVRLPQAPVDGGLLPLQVQRLAVARDAGSSFLYQGQLQAWRRAGHEIMLFSPLNNEAPDQRAEAVFLPGGYPELHAASLARATRFRAGMNSAAQRGVMIYGECGGYMMMGRTLSDQSATRFPMLGLLPVEFHMQPQRCALGYRQVCALNDQLFAKAGQKMRAHEFHYARAEITPENQSRVQAMFATQDALGQPCAEVGMRCDNVMGSFIHAIDLAD